jgi:hypothetical protein
MTAWVLDVFCNFYLVKNRKSVNNSTSTEAKEKVSRGWESLELQNCVV